MRARRRRRGGWWGGRCGGKWDDAKYASQLQTNNSPVFEASSPERVSHDTRVPLNLSFVSQLANNEYVMCTCLFLAEFMQSLSHTCTLQSLCMNNTALHFHLSQLGHSVALHKLPDVTARHCPIFLFSTGTLASR